MIRIHLTAADLAAIRFAPRPAQLQELHSALLMLGSREHQLLYGRWRQRLLRALPPAAEPLADLVPGGRAPAFLDVLAPTLPEGLEALRSLSPHFIRAELRRVYAGSPAPSWIHGLHQGEAAAWRTVGHAQRTAFDTVLGPVWPLIQDLHRAEFTRHALTVAEHGIGTALSGLIPGSRLTGSVWELAAPFDRDIHLHGRGLLLQPTFHWTGHPLLADLPGRPLVLTYPAGPGLPLAPDGDPDPEKALAAVLGRTRLRLLLLLTEEHSTGELARRLGVSDATASAHTAALRGAGLISTVRAGKAVRHRRTALGGLLVGRLSGPGDRPVRPAGEAW
ncbi:ArsR/SmtB family transcription factor [Streptomyces orinoci]|uniref:Helix-turn-helix domain-containing protein n=1 Tax=Streptomyces orinoci TaxID=67339 RepID=A0ABV3K488_STRON|nr:helix-turn-helix domain-containing protein [Streptomyces orinoci]